MAVAVERFITVCYPFYHCKVIYRMKDVMNVSTVLYRKINAKRVAYGYQTLKKTDRGIVPVSSNCCFVTVKVIAYFTVVAEVKNCTGFFVTVTYII